MPSLNWNQIEEQANRHYIEREAVKEIASFQTIMPVACIYCRTVYEYKDGLGKSDISHGACPECLKIAIAEVMKGEV